MRRRWAWACAVAIAAVALGGGAALAGNAPAARRGEMAAIAVEKGPAIDGTLADPIWQKCPPLELGQCTSPQPNSIATTARVLFDAVNLYVAFDCAEADTDGLVQNVTARDGETWQDDCVELFVAGDVREGYFHFVVNPKGALFDARTQGGTRDDKSYDSSAVVKASVEKGQRWVATMSVPLKELGACVGENQTWVLNLNRTRPARGGQPVMEWSWAVMNSNDYHQAADYGRVTGVGIPSREDGVTRQAAPPPEAPRADKGESVGGVIVYRHFGAVNIPEGKGGTEKTFDLKIAGAKGLKVAFLARGRNGATRAAFNLSDARSRDNTTSYAYRMVADEWTPVLYRVDRFRYNSATQGTIGNACEFTGLRFHGNKTDAGKAVLELRDFTIYRGEDAAPPEAPDGLAVRVDDDGVRLTWKPARDNVGIACYAVSRAGPDGKFAKVGCAYLPEFVDRPAAAGEFQYRVLAADFQDNIGPWSAVVSVEVKRPPKGGTPSEETSRQVEKPFAALVLTQLEKDRRGYAENVRKIHQAGQGKVAKGKVMMFGDSITGATLWPQEAEAAFGRYRVVAHGYPSMRTDFGRNRIKEELAGENPEFCCIMYGTNNDKSPKAIPPAMDDLLAIARACAERGTVPLIATIPPRGFTDPDSQPESRFNEAVIRMCRENQIPIAYVFEAFHAQPDRRKLVCPDGVHLVEGGFTAAGQAWGRTLRQVSYVLLGRPE